LSGARDTRRKEYGGTTIEAAIVLPFFLMVILSLAYIIRVFYTYNTVQNSLAEVGRKIGNMSYFYHMAGLKDFSDRLNDMAGEAGSTLNEQTSAIVSVFSSFNEAISGSPGDQANSGNIDALISKADDIAKGLSDASDLIASITEDPKSELRLFMTVFARKLNYEVTNRLVCLAAKGCLKNELGKRVESKNGDPALALGIKDGLKGISFENSSVFGDSESLEFVVEYSIKAPVPFSWVPELKLSNRVRIIAWTGGRGDSVRVGEKLGEDEEKEDDSSVWTRMDNDKRYWDRGLEIEKLQVAKIKNKNGISAMPAPAGYPVKDAYILDDKDQTIEFYDVFTLNPFMKTYTERPSAIKSEIKKHGKRLLEFETPDFIDTEKYRTIKRTVIVVFPENAERYAEEAFESARSELAKYNVDVILVKDYGSYTKPEE